MQTVTKTIDQFGNTYYHNEKGQWHNEEGPAYIHANGNVLYYINDKHVTSLKGYQQLSKSTEEDMTAMILKYGHSGFTQP